jgi:hypothetical protein
MVVCLSYRGRDLFFTLDIPSAHRQETSCGDQRYAVHYCRGGSFELREGVREGGREGGRESGEVGKEFHILIQAHKFKFIAYSIVIIEVIDHTLN